MEATASAPVAVASSSNAAIAATNTANVNRGAIKTTNVSRGAINTIYTTNINRGAISTMQDVKPVETPNWRNKPRSEPVPIAVASSSTNSSNGPNPPNENKKNWRIKPDKSINSESSDAAVQTKNPGAENDANNRTGNAKSRVFSPRHPRNNRNHGSPTNDAQNQTVQDVVPGRVLVTGYPTFTQPHDLLEVFTKFGNVRIDKCNSWSATLSYASDEQARRAINANKRLHIYGHFLSIRPYSAKLKSEECPQSPKKDFSMSKQKNLIVEPAKIDLTGDFHKQLDKILAAVRLNQDEIKKIQQLYADLEMAFQEPWPGCKAIPFGSITTGLGIKTSDADCFINLPPQHRGIHGNHVNRARRLLMQYPGAFAEILAIPRANTPIVKLYHIPTNTNCDITFKTPLGAQNSRLIAFLLQADPRITPVAVIVKYWAKVHELSGTGRLTNYTLTMMIIFYLQQPTVAILPSVEWLQRDRNNDLFVDYWNTGFMSNSIFLPKSSNTSTIPELLGGFFEYYSVFNFDEMAVCPFLGIPIKKEAFRDTKSLSSEFDLYKSNVLNNIVMPIRFQTPICVQDPFEQCHNVASTITSKLALDIVTYFKFAASAYEKEKVNDCLGFFKNILIEKPKLVRGKTAPEYRVNLFPRIINTIIDFEWKDVVRKLSITIFENMLKIKLGKVEEKLSPDSRKEKEKYMGNLTKPIWKRKKYNSMAQAAQMGIEEKQSLISEELLLKEVQPVSLQFQLTLTFCHDPKSAVISIRIINGDLNAFRDFGKFFISIMQNWFMQLLKPHSLPNCKDTAAKIAETVDKVNNTNDVLSDDDDEENVIIIEDSGTLAQEKHVAESSLQQSLDDMTGNDEASPEAADELEDACVNQ